MMLCPDDRMHVEHECQGQRSCIVGVKMSCAHQRGEFVQVEYTCIKGDNIYNIIYKIYYMNI